MNSRSKKQLLDYEPLKSWMDFDQALSILDSKRKGDAFELLCKYYFILHPKNEHINREKVWLLREVPVAVKKELGLGEDTGFDLLLQDKQGNYIPVQCKYHSDPKKNLSWDEASTFFGRYFANDTYKEAYICTSAYGVSRHYQDAKTKPVIRVMGTDFQKLDEEFFNQVRAHREGKKASYEPYYPRPHQQKAIKDAKKHFLKENNSRGKLIFPCGSGKSLTGFWLTQELKAKSIVVAVPSLSLVKQTLEVYLREIVANKKQVEWLCICSEGDIGASAEVKFEVAEVGVPCTTNEEAIKSWLERTNGTQRIIFTTYQSGRLIGQISKTLGQSFDLGIFDEAHKTVGSTSKLFSYLLFEENINISKRIFMTATERFYQGSKDDIVSMDDVDVYGEIFTHMSFKDAIEQNLLTDYKVITIDVSKAEIASFIRENKLVELSKEYGKEAEARSLASMLALRKAMKSFGIKNAVSFHSSIRKAQNASQVQDYISKHYDFNPIDSFTVDGKMATGKREVIINEFADSPKALITNARCLTEGVDVPNIDCIVFADPRRSKIDIVQALGRALRKKEGKEWGYVILPVVYDGDTHEIDNDNFKEILEVIRGLAANDERIKDGFKDKHSPEKTGGGQLAEEQFMFLTETIDESDFKGQLGIKLWEGLSRFNWLPFEEAREFSRQLGLNSQSQWIEHCKGPKRNPLIPQDPRAVYNNQWKGYGDWLGTGRIAYKDIQWISFSKSREIITKYGLESNRDWRNFTKSSDFPSEVPKSPEKVYKEEWQGWGHFLGHKSRFLPFAEARAFIQFRNFKNYGEFLDYAKSSNFPNNIPKVPRQTYKNEGWISFKDWIGKGFLSFPDARKFVRSLGLSNGLQWTEYINSGKKPANIPSNPRNVYSSEWLSLSDWLGPNARPKAINDRYFSFEEARAISRNTGILSQKEWLSYVKINGLPKGLPKDPYRVYSKNGWKDWRDWGGMDFYTYEEAKALVHRLGLDSVDMWNIYTRSKEFDARLPKDPYKFYPQFEGFIQFLNTDRLSQTRDFYSFKDARNFVHSLGLKTNGDYRRYAKTSAFNGRLPKKPDNFYYEKGWKGWIDWLGTSEKKWLSFEESRSFVRSKDIKSQIEWVRYCKAGKRPSNIPSAPYKVYINDGWKGWKDFLGTNKAE